MHGISARTVVTLLLVGALVLTAGCTALGLGDGDAEATESVESTATETSEETSEDTGSDGGDQSDSTGDGDSADDGDDSDAGDEADASDDDAETANASDVGDDAANASDGGEDGANTGTGDDDSNSGDEDDGHDHDGHDHDDDADETDDTTDTSTTESSGWLTVGVDETKLDLSARDQRGDEFSIQDDGFTWLANESGLTLAEALAHVDVEASAAEMNVDGEQYRDADDGTTVSYRVNGEPVDPDEYVLQDGDGVWVTVTTEETNFSSPGTYIKAAEQHAHGGMEFVVDGEEVDFSQEKYQTNHRHFHYEDGDGEKWHAHSVSTSLAYALSSLADIDVDGDAIEYEGTYYDPDDEGTAIDVTVNGEPVDPGTYVLKDGDSVRVVVESDE